MWVYSSKENYGLWFMIRCDQIYFVFFNNSQDLSENINITLFISLFKQTATWREEVLSVVEVVFETMEGIVHFSIIQIQRYGCDMANPNHRTDIKYVLNTIIFTPHWTMRAQMIFYVFLIHTIQRKPKYVYLHYDFLSSTCPHLVLRTVPTITFFHIFFRIAWNYKNDYV